MKKEDIEEVRFFSKVKKIHSKRFVLEKEFLFILIDIDMQGREDCLIV